MRCETTTYPFNSNGNSLHDQAADTLDRVMAASDKWEADHGGNSIRQWVKNSLINTITDLLPPQYILHIGESPVMSLGDLSLFIGKAKSRKTFAMTLIMAAMLGKVIAQMRAQGFEGKTRLIWFDTEQSRYYVQRALKTALRLAGTEDAIRIEVYSLRPHSPKERRDIISQVLYVDNPDDNILFAIIDGIRDLVSDINDADQATDIATWLLKVTDEKQMHISTVLHTNKGDNNARGHLGAELTNKAQTVFMIEKSSENKDVSIVKPEYCRDRDFEPFAFTIDDDGLPVILEDHQETAQQATRRKFSPFNYDLSIHNGLAVEVFSGKSEYGYGELWREIKMAFEEKYMTIGDNRAKEVLSHWQKNGIIQADESGPRRKYLLTSLTSLNQFKEPVKPV